MSRDSDRIELERRLEQVKRHVGNAPDALTKERMLALIQDPRALDDKAAE